MSTMSEDDRIKLVIDAAPTLRTPVDPPYDLWPGIMMAAGIRRRRQVAWIVPAVFLIILAVTLLVVSRGRIDNTAETQQRLASARTELQQAASMTSDHYKAVKLIELAPYARSDVHFCRDVLQAASAISSSRDRMKVLVELATVGAISNAELRQLYVDVARSIMSTKDRDRAISALTRVP
jgi:hypothetical protein